jgi:hypothetical protein
MHRVSLSFLVVVAFCAMSSTAHAGSVLFNASGAGADGVNLSASALFDISGNTLKITLRNTGDSSGSTKDKSANTLTGVFFDLPTGVTLTPVSAAIAAGDLLQGNKCDIGPCNGSTTNVGGEFVYQAGNWATHPGNHGIASSGYINADAGGGNFNGPNLDQPDAPDGINFGIVAPISASNQFKPNNGAMSDNPLIEEQVIFTMTIAGGTLTASDISNVSFQYGTSFSEPKLPPGMKPPPSVPEPSILMLFGSAVALSVRARLRRRG